MRLPVQAATLVALLGAMSSASAVEDPAPDATSVVAAGEPRWREPNRVWFSLSGFAGPSGFGYISDNQQPVVGGLLGTLGAELGLANGMTLGFEVAPATWISDTTRPSLSARLAVGYARKRIALALELGSALTFLYPQLGPSLRIGALDGTYARIRVSWALYPPQPVPVDLDLELSTPVREKLRTYVDLGAVYGSTIGVYATAGLKYMPGGNRSLRSSAFTVGAGVEWMQWSLGPMVTVGYERRL